jgi:hypothetical protein
MSMVSGGSSVKLGDATSAPILVKPGQDRPMFTNLTGISRLPRALKSSVAGLGSPLRSATTEEGVKFPTSALTLQSQKDQQIGSSTGGGSHLRAVVRYGAPGASVMASTHRQPQARAGHFREVP